MEIVANSYRKNGHVGGGGYNFCEKYTPFMCETMGTFENLRQSFQQERNVWTLWCKSECINSLWSPKSVAQMRKTEMNVIRGCFITRDLGALFET